MAATVTPQAVERLRELVREELVSGGPRFNREEVQQLVEAAVRRARAADATERRAAMWRWSPQSLELANALHEQLDEDRARAHAAA